MRLHWKTSLLPSWRFVIVAALWAVAITFLIDVTEAPFWMLYIAPVSAVPLMVRELRAIDTRYRQSKAKKMPPVERADRRHKPA